MKNSIIEYFKRVNDIYGIFRIFVTSIFTLVAVLVLDSLNIIRNNLLIVSLIFMILAVYLLILFFKKLKLISAKFINGTDFVLLWLLFICVFNSLGYISCFKTVLFIYSSKFCLVVYIIVFFGYCFGFNTSNFYSKS